MAQEFFEICENSVSTRDVDFKIPHVVGIVKALKKRSDFRILHQESKTDKAGKFCEIVVVDCVCSAVPNKNSKGIKNRERIGLVFCEDLVPQVRPLRKNFPHLPHQNHVAPDTPISLCLYYEPWQVVERFWTPQNHLNRIQWWLENASKGTLHHDDQPLEQFYFEGNLSLVLPPDFISKISDSAYSLKIIKRTEFGNKETYRSHFFGKNDAVNLNNTMETIAFRLTPIVHGEIEKPPKNLGELADQVSKHGGDFVLSLTNALREQLPPQFEPRFVDGSTMLVIEIPLLRKEGGTVENSIYKAFLLNQSIGELAASLGVGKCTETAGKKIWARDPAAETAGSRSWRDVKFNLADVQTALSRRFAQMTSNIEDPTSNFKGALAGVGALGSALAEIWSREGWGEWLIIDSDEIKAHNLGRHVAFDVDIGCSKVSVVKKRLECIFQPGCFNVTTLVGNVSDFVIPDLDPVLSSAELIVDSTTTLSAPRDLSATGVPRSVSVFLTPNGRDSVLLFEDKEKTVALDALEAQYYRGVISEPWGETHLEGNSSKMWVGAGCRDISAKIPLDSLRMHAAILARQIRIQRNQSNAKILIWTTNDATSETLLKQITPATPIGYDDEKSGWKIAYDEHLKERFNNLRTSALPNETGGMLIGYVDHKMKKIFIVDCTAAPSDSSGNECGFTRGTYGAKETLEKASKRTAGIVTYLGEWHSHPKNCSSNLSSKDLIQLEYLKDVLTTEGNPAVVLVVGCDGIKIKVAFES